MERLPEVDMTNIYIAVGAMVILNLGTIATVVGGVFRVIWFMAKLDARVESNTKDVNNAHKMIRDLKNGEC